jgi:plastocyanin
MQSSNSRRALAVVVLGAVSLVLAGPALGAGGKSRGKGPGKAKIVIKGSETFKRNAYIKDSVHFVAGTLSIRSGGTVTLTNMTDDPHTFSIVKPSQLPHTVKQIQECHVCGEIARSHGVNPEGPPTSGPPPIPLVNVGPAGFDESGDSIAINPKSHGGQVTFKITAPAGSTLNFMCAIHPWMQGRILVK